MPDQLKITRALISVFNKEGLEPVIHHLAKNNVEFISTGGTHEFIKKLGYKVTPVEALTGYPSVFGGRVKTLHPAIFGGILFRRNEPGDVAQATEMSIHGINLVIVDLYPFEETVAKGSDESVIIEKIDIGGIALIRAAAKNFADVLIVASRSEYGALLVALGHDGAISAETRRAFATRAFEVTSHYDTAIFNYFNKDGTGSTFKASYGPALQLRYGENPHQKAVFYGDLEKEFVQLHGKALSYNNLVDIEAALGLVGEFSHETAFVIVKHTNPCGMATAATALDAYQKALQADPVSAFGGILACTVPIDIAAATVINKLFFEILVAPDFGDGVLDLLKGKKNRIILRRMGAGTQEKTFRKVLGGVLEQEADLKTESVDELKPVTRRAPDERERKAMLFALKAVKHSKSNTIVLAVDGQLIASGVGQTSRVDALKQAIAKAAAFGFKLDDAIMASDAFFPFPDCVEIAHKAGMKAVVQPGGSVRDQESIDYCDQHDMAMTFTGYRHFRH